MQWLRKRYSHLLGPDYSETEVSCPLKRLKKMCIEHFNRKIELNPTLTSHLLSGLGEEHGHRQDPDVSAGKSRRNVSAHKSYEVVFTASASEKFLILAMNFGLKFGHSRKRAQLFGTCCFFP